MKKRVLLKISWEAFSWEKNFGIDMNSVEVIAKKISSISSTWVQLAITLGWWNIYRWSDLIKSWIHPADSHNLSMLSNVFNGMILKSILEKYSIESTIFDPNGIKFLTPYNKDRANDELNKWKVIIFVGWTWNPYFTNDSGWVLRALELDCEIMIKATKVDWVYDKDPVKYDDAKFFDKISYDDMINKNLKIIDQTALIIARDNWLKIKVVNFNIDWTIEKAIDWENIWTTISW